MKTREFAALGARLASEPELPGFTAKKNLLFFRPLGHILRGICFDNSCFKPKGFFVHVFVQPLFVPCNHIALNFGWRIGGGSPMWNADAPNLLSELSNGLRQEALPFLASVRNPDDLASSTVGVRKTGDPYVQQAIAFGFALVGNIERATATFDLLLRLLDVQIGWQKEMAERAAKLKAELLTDPAGVRRQLGSWEAETAKNLGLEEFR